MADHREHIRKAIAAMRAERRELISRVQQLDADANALEAILEREQVGVPTVMPREPGEFAKRGEAEREIIQMFAGGGALTASEIAEARGTTRNAASNVLRRLVERRVIVPIGGGRYQNRIASVDAQGSLAVDAAGEESEVAEGGGS